MTASNTREPDFPAFDRSFFESDSAFTKIGDGAVGGKAHGLAVAHQLLQRHFPEGGTDEIAINVPRFTVIGTDVFDAFIERNNLHDIAFSDEPDERIAHAFQKADLPVEHVGDLRALIEGVRTPLAVRSSSLLEDALAHPFAGVYETKMTPNNQPDVATRFRKLSEAIKFVYASAFFRQAKNYIRTTERTTHDEKMAVIIQEVVGRRYDTRFYPELSGVCRSYNFYPVGRVKPEDGVVNLALGLGKAIVDGGVTWVYSPQRPKAPPPFGSVRDLLRNTQTKFWAVNMAGPPAFDPIAEAEYLSHLELGDADYDGALSQLASTYNAQSDRLSPGVGPPGPRALNFAPCWS
jgi:hypothetical protein